MSDSTDKLIRAVYPPNMVRRVKSLFRNFSPEERYKAVQLMKQQKQMFKKVKLTKEVDGEATPF